MSDDPIHKNIKDVINETDLYELNKLFLDVIHNEWRKDAFWNKNENTYNMKSFNDMNHKHDNKVNNIALLYAEQHNIHKLISYYSRYNSQSEYTLKHY